MNVNVRETIPSRRPMASGRGDISVRHSEETDPLWTFQREMKRLFDDAFHGSFRDFGESSGFDRARDWPNIEVAKTGKEIKVMAELPGLDEKDVRVELSNNILVIDGEKKSEIEDHNRWFNERYFGHFERRIPLDWEVDEERVAASFRNGVLTVTLPKSGKAQEHTKRIPVGNGS